MKSKVPRHLNTPKLYYLYCVAVDEYNSATSFNNKNSQDQVLEDDIQGSAFYNIWLFHLKKKPKISSWNVIKPCVFCPFGCAHPYKKTKENK